MTKPNGIFGVVTSVHFSFLILTVIVGPLVSAKMWRPIMPKFPDTPERIGEGAVKYVKELLAPLTPGASKKDPNLIMTGESCARGLGSLYIVKTKGKTLYTVCFNDKKASAIYSTHIVDLANKTIEQSKHLTFKAKYTLRGWKVNSLYCARNQFNAFNKKFIPFTHPETRKNEYFSRNHLTPHADFALAKHQTMTYYFHNSFPGMQSMNVANWSKLEDFVRDLSTQMGKVLLVVTGVYGVLKKKTLTGHTMDVYLDQKNERIEVPLIVFKLVVDQKTNGSVAFFTSNDTEMDEQQQNQFLTICKSVCDEIAANFNPDVKAGLTVCCRYAQFAKHIQFIPFKLSKSNLLKNPKRIERSYSRSNSSLNSPPKMTKTNSSKITKINSSKMTKTDKVKLTKTNSVKITKTNSSKTMNTTSLDRSSSKRSASVRPLQSDNTLSTSEDLEAEASSLIKKLSISGSRNSRVSFQDTQSPSITSADQSILRADGSNSVINLSAERASQLKSSSMKRSARLAKIQIFP